MFSFCYIEVSIGKLLQQCGITLGAKDVSEKLRDNIAGNPRKHSTLTFYQIEHLKNEVSLILPSSIARNS